MFNNETFVQLLQVEQMNKTNSIYESLHHWNITKNEKTSQSMIKIQNELNN